MQQTKVNMIVQNVVVRSNNIYSVDLTLLTRSCVNKYSVYNLSNSMLITHSLWLAEMVTELELALSRV